MSSARTIKPVTYEEKVGAFRMMNDAEGMGIAPLTYCDADDPAYREAARSCLGLETGKLQPEKGWAAFVHAMQSAGVFVRDP